ncbi:MAG TPA: enoyl-CoA hydratase [Dermatophilaceae bacterium]|nr:enoyl-CoA hydratase [Dermatophilaceae bacterium]
MSLTERSYEHLLIDRDGLVATVTMNRPVKRNALSVAHMEELIDAFEAIGSEPGCAVVVLRAVGPVFCAGHDIAEMVGRSPADYEHIFAVCTRLMLTIRDLPQPVIAQVHALATAAGCQLAATCDLVVAAADASFATPGVRIGLFCSTPMVALSRAVGQKTSMEMLLTGDPLSAQEAREAGLVNRVVPGDLLAATVAELAARIAQASPAVVALGKRAFYRQRELPLDQAYDVAREVMVGNAGYQDAQEGMSAFLDKRAPVWRGR